MNNAPKFPEQICDLCRKRKPTSRAYHDGARHTIMVCEDPECRLFVTMPSVPEALKRRIVGRSY